MILQHFLPGPTDWRFVTSSGGDISFGLSELVNVGGATGELHVREGDGPVIRLQYVGVKAGLGVGVSLLGPVSGSFSLASFPGGGIGRIYKGPTAGARLSLNDMKGHFAMLNFASGLGGASYVSVVLLGLPVSPLSFGPFGQVATLLAKGAGVLFGGCASSSFSIEANSTMGTIVGAFFGDGLEVGGN